MIRLHPAAVLAFVFFATCATAQPMMQPPPFYNVVTLEASATAEVPADTLTATLFTEEQGPDPGQLAAKVNARIEEALAKAKSEPKVEARSGNYQTTPVYDRSNQITGWRIRADVVLESRDFKAIGALVGQLQPTLKLWSLTFSLSRRAREAVEATLTNEALGRFQEKARAIAKTLGFPGHTLSQISVRAEGPVQPVPMFRTAAAGMAEGMPPPPGPVPVEPGKGTVTVVVSGSVVLGPPK
jgi:predicted secreted protein